VQARLGLAPARLTHRPIRPPTPGFYRRVPACAQLPVIQRLTRAQTGKDSVHSARPGGWHSVTNFGMAPIALPAGNIAITRGPQPRWASATHHRMDRATGTSPARGQLSFMTA
jgi:hypothetical protein